MCDKNQLSRRKVNAAKTPEAGIVTNHAMIMLFVTPHQTAEGLYPAPTPIMLDDTT